MFLYYWIFHKDIALNLLLGAYFLEWKKKQQSEWKQTLVSSYFSTPQTVVSLSPFIRWCALFLCLFYIPIWKNKSLQNIRLPRFCYWVKGKQNQESTLWNAQSKSVSSHTKHYRIILKRRHSQNDLKFLCTLGCEFLSWVPTTKHLPTSILWKLY